jgi:alpha-ketoglutarate-dependent taurine dioxygenase
LSSLSFLKSLSSPGFQPSNPSIPKQANGWVEDGWNSPIDTLWASGYDLYDRISSPYQRFLESLTATYAQPGFNKAADANSFELYTAARGAPENVGSELRAVHPVIRTNPVTGWKSVFAVGHHVERIIGLTEQESRRLLDWFVRLIVDNHDLQVRHKWRNPNDLGEFVLRVPELGHRSSLVCGWHLPSYLG